MLPFIIPHMNNTIMQPVEILAPEDQFVPGVAQSVKVKTLVTGKNLIWGENTGLLRYFPESSAA